MKKILIFFLLFSFNVSAIETIDQVEEIAVDDSKRKANFSLSSKIRIEHSTSDNYQSTQDNDQFINSTMQANLNSELSLNKKWRFESWFRLAQVPRISPSGESIEPNGKTQTYNNIGLGIREMKFGYEDERLRAYVGKFRPHFGLAWGAGRGIWSSQVATNYQQLEKLGAAAYLRAGDIKKTGKYEFGLSFFTNDRKNFDNTLIQDRYSASKSDALVGDTRNLNSYVGTIDVFFDFDNNEKLSYRFSYLNLAINGRASSLDQSKIADQKGTSAMINYQYPIAKNFNLSSMIEFAQIKNSEGNSDVHDNYLTSSFVGNIYKNWNITLNYADHKNIYIGQDGYRQNMAEISGGYTFFQSKAFDSLLLQAGYRNLRTDYKTSLDVKNGYAILARYIKNF